MTKIAKLGLLESETDEVLMTVIAKQAEDKSEAYEALRVLHQRYSSKFLRQISSRGVDSDIIVSKTFCAVWESAEKFDVNKRRTGTPVKGAVERWMSQILHNELTSELRICARRNEIALWDGFGKDADDKDELEHPSENHDEVIPTPEFSPTDGLPHPKHYEYYEKLRSTLSPKEQQILDMSASYIEPNPPFACHIPKDELCYFAKQIGTLPASIKVRRQRIFTKLRNLTDSNLQSPTKL